MNLREGHRLGIIVSRQVIQCNIICADPGGLSKSLHLPLVDKEAEPGRSKGKPNQSATADYSRVVSLPTYLP